MLKSWTVLAAIIFLASGFALAESAESKIPEWVKNTALWYGQDKISEVEFINAIKFLLQNKIIILDESEPAITHEEPPYEQKVEPTKQTCSGSARCITGKVTRIIDGDTIKVDTHTIRFSLVDTPEYGKPGFAEAREYIEEICPVGSAVLVDEDDGQSQGSYGRILAEVHCNGKNLNEVILEAGHAKISSYYCSKSEFLQSSWAQKHGCVVAISKPPQTNMPAQTEKISCDESYPDVCIPPYPPDLNCADISYTDFKVVAPDPHRFDGDKDGIGCES